MAKETPRSRLPRSPFVFIAFILCGTVIWGFWQSYFWSVVTFGVDRPWVVHVHAAVFAGWIGLLVTQVLAVLRGNTSLHKRLGVAGMGYAILVFAVGLVVSVAVPVSGARAGNFSSEIAGLVAVYLVTDMLIFGGFSVLPFLRMTCSVEFQVLAVWGSSSSPHGFDRGSEQQSMERLLLVDFTHLNLGRS